MKLKMLALALGLSALALTAPPTAAAATCEAQCHRNNGLCVRICRENPCLSSCEDQLAFCLQGCVTG